MRTRGSWVRVLVCVGVLSGPVLATNGIAAPVSIPPAPTSCAAPDMQVYQEGGTATREVQVVAVLRRVQQSCPTGFIDLRAARAEGSAYSGTIARVPVPLPNTEASVRLLDQDLCEVPPKPFLVVNSSTNGLAHRKLCEVSELTVAYAPTTYAHATRQPIDSCAFLGLDVGRRSSVAHAKREVITVKVLALAVGLKTANREVKLTISDGGVTTPALDSPDAVAGRSGPAQLGGTCQAE
jgi:hypothetical protein